MTSHVAIRDSIVEISRRIGRHNLDVTEMKQLMEFIERSKAGEEFTSKIREYVNPVSQYISTRNIDEIEKIHRPFPLKKILQKVPSAEHDAIWQAIGMTNMLLTTLQMVPPDMLSKIETMTDTMMGAMQNGNGLNELFKNIGGAMQNGNGMSDLLTNVAGALGAQDGDESDEDITLPSGPPVKSPPPKKTRQQQFRDKLC